MEAVIALVGEKAGEFAFDLIKREMSYILNYKTNVENLKEGLDDLKAARQRVHRSVIEAKRKGEEIYEDVEKWLTKVDEKILEQAAAQISNKRCLISFCPDLKLRYQLSKKSEKEADAIAELLRKGRFDDVSYQRKYYLQVSALNIVIERCAELPITIATVGKAALERNKTLVELKNALDELKLPFVTSFKRKENEAKRKVWPRSDPIDFVFAGSVRVLIASRFKSFQSQVTSNSNQVNSKFFQFRIISESGVFQIWTTSNSMA